MDLRTGAGVRRFESVEIGAVAVIVLASVVQGFFLYRLVPVLAFLHAVAGEALSVHCPRPSAGESCWWWLPSPDRSPSLGFISWLKIACCKR